MRYLISIVRGWVNYKINKGDGQYNLIAYKTRIYSKYSVSIREEELYMALQLRLQDTLDHIVAKLLNARL